MSACMPSAETGLQLTLPGLCLRCVSVCLSLCLSFDTQQAQDLLDTSKEGDAFVFTAIGYKENCTVPIIEESQKLYIAVTLAKAKRKVTLRDRGNLILAAQQAYGGLFEYEVIDMGGAEPVVQQPAASAHSSRSLGASDSYGVRRL